jgi:uncharacterized membrane protein YcaP (DUF421 family)
MVFQNEYLDIIVRSVVVYLAIVIFIRLFGKKELAQLTVVDLVFILLISNSVQNSMVGPSTSLQGGLISALKNSMNLYRGMLLCLYIMAK